PLAVPEIHCDMSDAHFRARALRAKADRNPFVWLDIQDQAIGLHLALAKYDVRSAVKLDHDFRAAFCKTLARANVKRHPGPAPIVDEQFSRDRKSTRLNSSHVA